MNKEGKWALYQERQVTAAVRRAVICDFTGCKRNVETGKNDPGKEDMATIKALLFTNTNTTLNEELTRAEGSRRCTTKDGTSIDWDGVSSHASSVVWISKAMQVLEQS